MKKTKKTKTEEVKQEIPQTVEEWFYQECEKEWVDQMYGKSK